MNDLNREGFEFDIEIRRKAVATVLLKMGRKAHKYSRVRKELKANV